MQGHIARPELHLYSPCPLIKVNVYGTAAATRIFLPLVRQAAAGGTKGRQPRIIFMSSIVGECDQACGEWCAPWHAVIRLAELQILQKCDVASICFCSTWCTLV